MSNQSLREVAQRAKGVLELALHYRGVVLTSYPPQDPWDVYGIGFKAQAVIAELEEALAQPDDKAQPVAYTTGIEWAQKPHWESEKVVKITRRAQPEHGFIYPLYAAPHPPAEQGSELSDELLCKEARLALGHVPAERYRNGLLKLMRKVIAADRAQRPSGAELSDYPPLPKHLHTAGYLAKSPPLYTEDQMRAYVDADRAARGGAA